MPYAKIINVFGFLIICRSASFARAPVLPERQFCQSAVSFARARSVLPERQFARALVLPERQFCQ
jgi:hypothetical protein